MSLVQVQRLLPCPELDFALLNGGEGGASALLHEVEKHGHRESGGVDIEAFMKELAGDAEMMPVLEFASDLVERRQSTLGSGCSIAEFPLTALMDC